MAEIQGTFDERFAGVRDVLSANLDRGADVGASVCVVHDGRTVADIWGGTIDDAGTPWAQDTIINVWSTTKTMTALTALLLADRGELDFHQRVAHYWPEFAANGKEHIEVRHLMAHTAGLSGWDEPMTEADVCDWEKATSLLAAQAPWWEPGTASGYHALSQGYLVGEVIRRVTGRTVGTFFREELAEPLGADFHIGTPASCDDRVAKLVPPPKRQIPFDGDPGDIAYRIWGNPSAGAETSATEGWRRAEIPAANGHGNARSVARVQAIVSHGGELDGVRFLSPNTIERIFEVQMEGQRDLGVGYPLTFGIGYGLITKALPVAPIDRGCFWAGMGGSIVVNDLDRRITVAYVMNKMATTGAGDARGARMAYAVYANLLG